MSKGERRRTRISSTIDKLPDDIKTELDVRLADTANTYEDLSAWLKAEGYEISKSAIGRYAIRSTQAAQRVAETLQRTQAIAQAVEAHPDLDYTKAASMVLMDGLMQRVSTAEDDFAEMPLDKAGRLIASLARNATEGSESGGSGEGSSGKQVIIQKLLIPVDLKKIKDLEQLLAMLKEVEDYAEANGSEEPADDQDAEPAPA